MYRCTLITGQCRRLARLFNERDVPLARMLGSMTSSRLLTFNVACVTIVSSSVCGILGTVTLSWDRQPGRAPTQRNRNSTMTGDMTDTRTTDVEDVVAASKKNE